LNGDEVLALAQRSDSFEILGRVRHGRTVYRDAEVEVMRYEGNYPTLATEARMGHQDLQQSWVNS
jgi:hypothetical protein